jgi:UDP-2,3-diacylglucosamine hydrolase
MQENLNHHLTILAGGGPLPAMLVAAAQAKGWAAGVVSFQAQPQPINLPEGIKPQQFALGQVGHILAHLKATHTTHVALVGHLHKPSILSLKPDATGLKLLARAMIKHDDALLRSVTDFLQEQGFTLVSAPDLVPSLLAPKGALANARPTPEELDDLALGRTVLAVLGDLDIGQACIVHQGAVLGVEAVEGTDALIERCAILRGEPSGGVLIKRAKALQTELADLPFVGPTTMELLGHHGYRGLAVQAGKTLLLNQPEMIRLANQHRLFFESDA